MIKEFGEPKKYGVFLSVRRSLSAHWPAGQTMGVFFVWVLLSLLIVSISVPRAQAEIIERVVAVVDEDIILLSELRRRAMPMLEQVLSGASTKQERRKNVQQLYQNLLKQFVNEKLIEQTAKEMSVTVTKKEVDQAIENVRAQNSLSEEQFKAAILNQGYTESQYREDLRKQLLRLKVSNQRIRGRINITEEDVREKYNEKLRKARRSQRFHASHIFFELSPTASATEVMKVRSQAEELQSQLNAKNFDEVMGKYGGDDLGWLSQGDLPYELERTLLELDPGQISKPVRGPSGIHIFWLVERQRSDVQLPPFKEVRDSIYQQMMQEQMVRQEHQFIEELRRQATIKIRLQ